MDPYAAKGWPRRSGERLSERDHFLRRMADLGADDEELRLVREGWDDFEPDDHPDAYTPAKRAAMVRMPDAELRGMLLAAREEYELGTTTEEEAEAARQAAAYRIALQAANERMGYAVPDLLAWVGEDLVRARAVLTLERDSDGTPRKTLLGPLREMLGEAL